MLTPRSQHRLHPRSAASDREDGIAMVMALLILMVCSIIVAASIALAIHAGGQSAEQRNLTAALHAADYGLQAELASLSAEPAAGGASCTPVNNGAKSLLPNPSLPAQWFSVSLPACSTGTLTRTIIATGYALGAGSNPASIPPSTAIARTIVSHVTLNPAGALSNGGYGFPDAILSFGALTASAANPLTVTPLAGYATSIRSVGAVNLAGGSESTSVSAWNSVTLSANPVTGNVSSSGAVSLANGSNVTGNAVGSSVTKDASSTVSGNTRSGVTTLPVQPPVPTFSYSQTDWLSLTGAPSPTTSCPASGGTLTGLYVVSASCTLSPSTVSTGAVAVIATAGNLTVTIPTFDGPGPSQLYLIAPSGNITLTDGGSAATQIFAYASGTTTVSGTIIGQLVGATVTTSAATTLDAELVSTTLGNGSVVYPPDFSFPSPVPTPAPTGYVPQISDEYLCPTGVTTAC